jgi:inorganic triphosphatase YgiF
MSQEIELKLLLPQRQLSRLRSHPLLKGNPSKTQRLINTYYDTPDCQLYRHGVAMRFRRRGWEWLLTVKTTEAASGGLARRQEWEVPARPGVFDFSHVTDKRLRKFLVSHTPALIPVFTTTFQRQTWLLDGKPGTQVEVAVDRGHVESGEQKAPLSEVELELVGGDDAQALFTLALTLCESADLHPESESKAERGYALYGKRKKAPFKAGISPVDDQMTPAAAFQAIAFDCMTHLQRNERGAIAGDDPEFVHQARVAIRRLRSAVGLFAAYLPADLPSQFGPRWRDTAQSMGGARDWDVLLDETLPPLEEAFPGHPDLKRLRDRGERTQAGAAVAAKKALTAPEYSRLLIEFGSALAALPTAPKKLKKKRTLHQDAFKLLDKRFAQILKRATSLREMSVEQRHDFRIAFKKLRYAIEFFTPLMGKKAVRAYLGALNHLQKRLGHLNDIATAQGLVSETFGSSPSALVQGWFAGQQGILLEALIPEVDHYIHLPPPWRHR